MVVVLTKTFFVYLMTVQIRPRLLILGIEASFCTSCKYRAYLNTWDCLNKLMLLYNIHKHNNLVNIIREFLWDNTFQIMFLINILTSFYHLKAKFSKTIILIMRVIAHFEVLFPIEETIVKSVITYSKLNSSNMFRQSQVFRYTLHW